MANQDEVESKWQVLEETSVQTIKSRDVSVRQATNAERKQKLLDERIIHDDDEQIYLSKKKGSGRVLRKEPDKERRKRQKK